MKVIDLLVKIANGEKVPKKVKVLDKTLSPEIYQTITWNEDIGQYEYCDGCQFDRVLDKFHLNDEVEIIENIPKEDKKIEKIDISKFPKRNNSLKKTALKLNEIIEKVNGE